MTEGAGALPLTTYIGRGPNAPRVWYMLKYLCTRGAVAAVSRYEWWCVLLECICTLSLDPRLLRARAHFNMARDTNMKIQNANLNEFHHKLKHPLARQWNPRHIRR